MGEVKSPPLSRAPPSHSSHSCPSRRSVSILMSGPTCRGGTSVSMLHDDGAASGLSTGVCRRSVAGVKPEGFRGVFRDDDSARAVYAEGAGIARAMPAAVAVPVDADDVSALVRWAAASKTPLVARGSGSGMAGGAVGPGVIVDLSRIDFVGRIDTERRRVMVGPGALRGAVNELARGKGLRFPVDTSSGAFCTIGGMAATNAAGAHTLRYGC